MNTKLCKCGKKARHGSIACCDEHYDMIRNGRGYILRNRRNPTCKYEGCHKESQNGMEFCGNYHRQKHKMKKKNQYVTNQQVFRPQPKQTGIYGIPLYKSPKQYGQRPQIIISRRMIPCLSYENK